MVYLLALDEDAGIALMQLQVNGSPHVFDGEGTLLDLAIVLNLALESVICECNGVLHRHDQFAAIQLQAGDQIEFLHFMGGGA